MTEVIGGEGGDCEAEFPECDMSSASCNTWAQNAPSGKKRCCYACAGVCAGNSAGAQIPDDLDC